MNNNIGGGVSKAPLSCMPQDVLRHLVKIAGLQDMTMWRTRKKEWRLSVKVKHRLHVLYLSTRRVPRVPRAFKRLDAALAAGERISATRQFTLVLL